MGRFINYKESLNCGGLPWQWPRSMGRPNVPDALPDWEIIRRACANLPPLAAICWTKACMLSAVSTHLLVLVA